MILAFRLFLVGLVVVSMCKGQQGSTKEQQQQRFYYFFHDGACGLNQTATISGYWQHNAKPPAIADFSCGSAIAGQCTCASPCPDT